MGLGVVCMAPWAQASEAASAVIPASVHCGIDSLLSFGIKISQIAEGWWDFECWCPLQRRFLTHVGSQGWHVKYFASLFPSFCPQSAVAWRPARYCSASVDTQLGILTQETSIKTLTNARCSSNNFEVVLNIIDFCYNCLRNVAMQWWAVCACPNATPSKYCITVLQTFFCLTNKVWLFQKQNPVFFLRDCTILLLSESRQ